MVSSFAARLGLRKKLLPGPQSEHRDGQVLGVPLVVFVRTPAEVG